MKISMYTNACSRKLACKHMPHQTMAGITEPVLSTLFTDWEGYSNSEAHNGISG
jgi:hypothetical protein